MFIYAATLFLLTLPSVTGTCHADNCYRAIKFYQTATATEFCSEYLDHATVAPSQFASCGPSRLSSACSCLASSTSTSVPSTTTSPTPIELISNGGFESGNTSPWAVAPGSGYVRITDNEQSTVNFPFEAHSGEKFAQIGNSGDENPTTLSQSVSLTSGINYSFKAFYSVLDLPLSSCYLQASIDANPFALATIYSGAGGGNPPRYYLLSGSFTASTTGISNLAVALWCDYSSIGGVFGLDDVSLL
ncbi:unnamed protein product [Clonostachys rhizophaga]|uniref:CBM-cenC domain-containing protein n=1 Tax=Clonostachys rhizophaga TaxID=160324 RepID=A0A9N9VS69_9HYPO|nr:unnamed protein product [Clonostachys rhizophaga]